MTKEGYKDLHKNAKATGLTPFWTGSPFLEL